MKHLIIVALTLFLAMIAAETSHACQEGNYWVFKIERKSEAYSSSRDLNGTYKVECSQNALTADNGDTQYFTYSVPSVEGLSAEIPWFCGKTMTMKPGDTCNYKFEYASDNRRKYEVSGTVKAESFVTKTITLGAFETAKITAIDSGHRAGKRTHTYYFSPKAGSIVAADIEYGSGTTYKMELMEYKNASD
jgi:hypothetical protein